MKKRGRTRATHLHSSILSTGDTSPSNVLVYCPRIVAIIIESLLYRYGVPFYLNMCEHEQASNRCWETIQIIIQMHHS